MIQPQSLNNGHDSYGLQGNLNLPDGRQGVYDFFITDHQQSVRMILSEEVQWASNTATMESSRAAQEEPVFGQVGAANEVAATRSATPAGWQSGSVGAQVSRLGSLGGGQMLGPNTLQKVMAGDQLSATVQYYYQGAAGTSQPLTTVLLNTLGQLLSAGSQVGTLVKGNVSAVTTQLSGHPGFITAVNPTQGGSQTPQAYLTLLFFDERFEPIAESDGGVVRQQVASAVGSAGATLGLGNIRAPRNGYVLVYVSNSSEQYVYFDNLQVGKVNGNLLEENHYYSFGLRIQALSSRRFTDGFQGQARNDYLYNGKERMDGEADPGWLEYGFRYYDPQIGRFHQIDPLSDDLEAFSPYHYAYNDPIMLIDWMGLFGDIPVLQRINDVIVTKNTFMTAINITIPRKTAAVAQVANKVSRVNTLATMGRVAADLTPFVGAALDIGEGIRDGNYWKVAGGVTLLP